MSILFFLGGRHDKKKWGKVLAETGSNLKGSEDEKTLAKVTDQMITEDCRIIRECAQVLMNSQDPEQKKKSRLVMFSRHARLTKLEPYADKQHKQLISKIKQLVVKARQY